MNKISKSKIEPCERKGFKICPQQLKCIECGVMQDDIKSLQEHLKLCLKNSKMRFYVCYCEAEFSDRALFDNHIRWFQCAQKFHAKLNPMATAMNYSLGGNKLENGKVTSANGLLKENLKRSSPPRD